jgi:hypothetical protein
MYSEMESIHKERMANLLIWTLHPMQGTYRITNAFCRLSGSLCQSNIGVILELIVDRVSMIIMMQ